ncbi:MAG: lytic amidase [Firmicutes bacterium]|nr:lytic amidase [Bacillota bacterium]
MNKIKVLTFSLLISLLCSLTAFGWNEGMVANKYTSNEQVWRFYTGEENENGTACYLKSQWKEVWDNWYYFGEDGLSKQNTWAEIDGKWYYFDQWSIMQHDTIIEGHTVGPDGAWIPVNGEAAPVPVTQQY